jgi:DNA-binding transcriptional LysR family regulator
VLRLSTFALLAHEFLLPRLSQFRASFPQLSLRVESSNRYVDLCSSECAAAIRHGNGWPELTAYPLGKVFAAVICSPKLASSIRTPSDLLQHTLLDVDGDGARGYAMLMQAHGLPMQPSKVWHFETCHETLTAAEHGLGFGFALFPIATHWISSGRLVALAEPLQLPGELALVHRPGDASRFPFAELAAWLRAQYAALPALERRPATRQAVHSAEQPAEVFLGTADAAKIRSEASARE